MSDYGFPEWFYCLICQEEIENEQEAYFIPEEHRQVHQACLDKEK